MFNPKTQYGKTNQESINALHFADGDLHSSNPLGINLIEAVVAHDVEFLMGLVGVLEAAVQIGYKRQERQLAAGGAHRLTYKHLALDDMGTHRELTLNNLFDISHVDGGIVAAALDVFDCSHYCSFF